MDFEDSPGRPPEIGFDRAAIRFVFVGDPHEPC
jgi:hypothetical protein